MTYDPNDPPDSIETWGKFSAEYRRMLDSQGEEHIGVTLWHPDDKLGERVFHIEMDALERIASHEVAKGYFAKPLLDERMPDAVERFKEYTAFVHAWTSQKDGREISAVHLTYAKEKDGEQLDQEIWIPHQALKKFSAHGIEYEKELGLTKRWYPVVRVVCLGHPNGSAVVQTLESVEDKDGARERAQRQADQSDEDVLWSHPFRKRLEAGDQFTVNGRMTDGLIGIDKIDERIGRLHLEESIRSVCGAEMMYRLQEMSPNERRKWVLNGL